MDTPWPTNKFSPIVIVTVYPRATAPETRHYRLIIWHCQQVGLWVRTKIRLLNVIRLLRYEIGTNRLIAVGE